MFELDTQGHPKLLGLANGQAAEVRQAQAVDAHGGRRASLASPHAAKRRIGTTT
jgi:hypothetical protein